MGTFLKPLHLWASVSLDGKLGRTRTETAGLVEWARQAAQKLWTNLPAWKADPLLTYFPSGKIRQLLSSSPVSPPPAVEPFHVLGDSALHQFLFEHHKVQALHLHWRPMLVGSSQLLSAPFPLSTSHRLTFRPVDHFVTDQGLFITYKR